MSSIDPNQIGSGTMDGLILYELREIRSSLQELVSLEKERREAEKRLEDLALSLPRPSTSGFQPAAENLDGVPWGDETSQLSEEEMEKLGAFLDSGWYRDDGKVYRYRETGIPLPQNLIDLIHSPEGRRRQKVKI